MLDLTTMDVTLFEGVDTTSREALAAKTQELFVEHKGTRQNMPDDAMRKPYNSALWRRLNDLAGKAKREATATRRVGTSKEIKGALKAHIKGEAKVKADATMLTDVILAQLRDAGVDLSPLDKLLSSES